MSSHPRAAHEPWRIPNSITRTGIYAGPRDRPEDLVIARESLRDKLLQDWTVFKHVSSGQRFHGEDIRRKAPHQPRFSWPPAFSANDAGLSVPEPLYVRQTQRA